MCKCVGARREGETDRERHAETSIDRERETQRNRNSGRDRGLYMQEKKTCRE